MLCWGQTPGELETEGSLKGVNSTCLLSAQNSSMAPMALRIETSPASGLQDCVCFSPAHRTHPYLSVPPPISPFWPTDLLSAPLACCGPGPLHTRFPLPEIILSGSASFKTHSSLQSQFRSHFPQKSFPQLALSLAVPAPLSNRSRWVVYLQHVFLPEPGRKRDCAVLHPQERTALPWGPSSLAGLCSPGPSALRPITRGLHLTGL